MPVGGVMADVSGGHHEDDVLGDVGRVVANPFEVARNQDQIERRFHSMQVGEHVGAASAMLIARSPTRSRSVLIFTAATIARRSTAIGWYSASSRKHRLSTSMCSALSGSSPMSARAM